jgi:hypothetical protein
MAEPVPLPIACTLTGASLEERGEWLRRLGEWALIDGVRRGDRLEVTFRPEAAADVRELVRAERECCPFLELRVETGERQVGLVVAAPPQGAPVLDALLAQLAVRPGG